MERQIVSQIYRKVIDEVLQKTRDDILIGVDETTADTIIENLLHVYIYKLCNHNFDI